MGLLDKAKKRQKQIKSRRTAPKVKKPIKTTRTTKRPAPGRGLLHRAKHRKKELDIKTSTKFKRELKSSESDPVKTKEDKFKERSQSMVSIGPTYSTMIDKIYHHVKAVKSMNLKKLMKMFNLKRSEIEHWANILDEEGLLELYYPPVGEAMLRVPEVAVSKKTKAKAAKQKKKLSPKEEQKKERKKKMKIAAVSVVFAVFMVVLGLYIIVPDLVKPFVDPVIGVFRYIMGQITLLIGG